MNLMRIGHVSERLGVDQKTIRFYERKGLLKPLRNRSNYRVYSREDINTLHFILSARAYKLSIREIRMLLQLKRRKGDICTDVTDVFKERFEIITAEINHLKTIRKNIKKCLKTRVQPNCCRRRICDIVQGGALWKK